jgi:hypothetical protein
VIEASASKYGDVNRLQFYENYSQQVQNIKLDTIVKPIQIKSRKTNTKTASSGFQKLGVEVFELKTRKIDEQRQMNKQVSPLKTRPVSDSAAALKSVR